MDIVAECRAILASAKPANANRPPCGCNARMLPQAGVDELLRRLDAVPVLGRTSERPPGRLSVRARIRTSPAPWVRAMISSGG